MGEDEKEQFNVYLRAEVIRAIKHAAIDRGQRLGAFVEAIFEDYLRRHRAARPEEEP